MATTINELPIVTAQKLVRQFDTPEPITNISRAQIIISSFGLPLLKSALYKGQIEGLDAVSRLNTNQGLPLEAVEFKEFGTPNTRGQLGNVVFSNIVFPDGRGIVEGREVEYRGVRIDVVLIEVSKQKNLKRDMVTGRQGTVKQSVSSDDYAINIKGALLSPRGDRYPIQDVERLEKILNIDSEIEVNSWFLNRRGINKIVVDYFHFPQSEGTFNEQIFEIQAFSDKDIEFLIE